MSPSSWPYAVNILILVPVGLGALFNGWAVAEGRFPESAGWRTLVGALWTAILVGSVLGLFRPVVFSPLLFLQIVYKSLWLMVYVAPRLMDPRARQEIPWGIAGTFLLIVIAYPFAVPWAHLFHGRPD